MSGKETFVCPSCRRSHSASPDSCPHCGDSGQQFKINPEVPSLGITLEIAYSPSPFFQQAMEVANKHPQFVKIGEGKQLRFRVTYTFDQLEALAELKDIAWELREKRAYLNGIEFPWEDMAGLTYCYHWKQTKGKPDHCFFDSNYLNIWGCRYGQAYFTDKQISNHWLHWGGVDGEGNFVFDKPRIVDSVNRRLFGFHLCPAYNDHFVEVLAQVFPDKVSPEADPRWRYLYDDQKKVIAVAPFGLENSQKLFTEYVEQIRQRGGPATSKLPPAKKIPPPSRSSPQRAVSRPGLLRRLFKRSPQP